MAKNPCRTTKEGQAQKLNVSIATNSVYLNSLERKPFQMPFNRLIRILVHHVLPPIFNFNDRLETRARVLLPRLQVHIPKQRLVRLALEFRDDH
jgi:hypothetical protein